MLDIYKKRYKFSNFKYGEKKIITKQLFLWYGISNMYVNLSYNTEMVQVRAQFKTNGTQSDVNQSKNRNDLNASIQVQSNNKMNIRCLVNSERASVRMSV